MGVKIGMFHTSIPQTKAFLAGDHTLLREVLHPAHTQFPLPYSLAHAVLKPQTESLPHTLKNAEVYVFLEGTGVMVVEENQQAVQAGDVIVVQPLEKQYVKNTGKVDLVFLCIVSPPWTPESEMIFDKK